MKKDFDKFVEQLQCQFLCALPLDDFDWNRLKRYNSWDEQKHLLDATCGHPLNRKQPLQIAYQQNFLKRVLNIFERNCNEIRDELYEEYCQLLLLQCRNVGEKEEEEEEEHQQQQEQFAYKHYLLCAYKTHITLLESKSFVLDGTTGLCSWPASLALAEYLLHHPDIVREKCVLELGAGTGLCGFIVTRCCGPKRVCLTDGSRTCVELMHKNVRLNFSDAIKDRNDCYQLSPQQLLICSQLCWNNIEETKTLELIESDVILAADVVYDKSVLPQLVHAIDYIFKIMLNRTQMLLSTTVRNVDTLKTFLELLDNLNFTCVELETTALSRSQLNWDRKTPIKIFQIIRMASIN